jgi:CheY-like chemotaxis protein
MIRKNTFATIFREYRLRSGLASLSIFGHALAKHGHVYEDSLYSHWQKGRRIPRHRDLLLAIIATFREKDGITTIHEANALLESVGQGHLTPQEMQTLDMASGYVPYQESVSLHKPKQILLVEDDPDISDVFCKQLVYVGGFHVDRVHTGQEGLTKMTQETSDVVILDLIMPDIDGIEILNHVYTQQPPIKTPILILSNVTSPSVHERVRQYPIVDYLIKTEIEPRVLIKRIHTILQT